MEHSKMTTVQVDGGHVFSAAGATYFAPLSQPGIKPPAPLADDLGLATVFNIPRRDGDKHHITANWVRASVEAYEKNDDVFDRAFLATVVFHGASENEVILADEAREYLRDLGNQHITFVTVPQELLPGPYVRIGGELRDVWKLVDDTNGTCMVTLKPKLEPLDAFEPFHQMSIGSQSSQFALLSRIKARAAFNSPIAGLRVVMKDNIHLKGIKTSVGNRAFYDAFPPRTETAACIQSLLDQGLLLAGKTKLNPFGNWEEPIEHIDYQAPWNPRADKYQSCGGSSTGSAAAIAAYDWLDIAIGTDTWASVTRPALWCGCFGLRPSIGAVPQIGIEPFCRKFDTAGFLARDLGTCKTFAAHWLNANALQKEVKPFSSVIWPSDFWSIVDSHQVTIAREFASTVQSVLNISCQEISFQEAWQKSPPPEAEGISLPEFINAAAGVQTYDAYESSQNFISQYQKLFNHPPYVSPRTRNMWAFAKTISKEERDKGFARVDIYERWFYEAILTEKHANALIIMPLESMSPRYRDEPPSFRRPPQDGINALGLAPVMKCPLLAVPVAEIPYHSKVTEREEKLPFAVAIMSKQGTDLSLLDAAYEVLSKGGMATAVKTGRRMFS